MEREEKVEGIKRLLEEAGKVLADIDKKVSEGAGFNVFRLCGVDHYETMHSKILAEFLNPKGSHGQGKLFLDLFCEMLRRLGFDGSFSSNVNVSTEFTGYIKGESVGRFDILIEDNSTSSVCVIENKIFASEQPEQLKRYADWLRRERKGWKQVLVFLTLNGREAWSIKDQALYQRAAYVSQSKKPSLVDWIDSCLKKIDGEDKPFIQSALKQYKKLIINLSTGEQAMSEALLEIIKDEKFMMEAAEKIALHYDDVKWKILKEVADEIASKVQRNLNVDCLEIDYAYQKKSSEPGYAFWIGGWNSPPPVWIAWQSSNDMRLWTGVHKVNFSSQKELGRFRRWLKDSRGWLTDDDNWPWYKWLGGDGEKTPTWDGKFLDKLLKSPEFRTEVIDKITKDIVDLYHMTCEFRESTRNKKVGK